MNQNISNLNGPTLSNAESGRSRDVPITADCRSGSCMIGNSVSFGCSYPRSMASSVHRRCGTPFSNSYEPSTRACACWIRVRLIQGIESRSPFQNRTMRGRCFWSRNGSASRAKSYSANPLRRGFVQSSVRAEITMRVPDQSALGFGPPTVGLTSISSSIASSLENSDQSISRRLSFESWRRAVSTRRRSPSLIADRRPIPFSPRNGAFASPRARAFSTSRLRDAVPMTRKLSVRC